MGHTHVVSIATAVPRHRAPQRQVAHFMERVARSSAGPAEAETSVALERTCSALSRLYRSSAIRSRASVLPDYTSVPEDFTFYPKNWQLWPFPSTAARMEVYRREAPRLASQVTRRCLDSAPHVPREAISHLVVVSCTGLLAPGLDVLLARELGLRPDVQRQVIGFMGCHAALTGLRAAHAICRAEPEAVVILVCVELCTLHFQIEPSLDNLVTNSLLGDGAAAVLLAGERAAEGRARLVLLDVYSLLTEDDTLAEMTWTVTDTGFQLAVSPVVPEIVREHAGAFIDTLLGRNGLNREAIGLWAIHPGERQIVEAVQERLGLPDEAAAPSYEVLAEHGNMSSPTVIFVLERCLLRSPAQSTLGVAMAFGPGLSLESALFRTLAAG